MSTPTKEDAVNRIDPFSPAKTGIDTSGNPVALGDIDSDGYFVGHITIDGCVFESRIERDRAIGAGRLNDAVIAAEKNGTTPPTPLDVLLAAGVDPSNIGEALAEYRSQRRMIDWIAGRISFPFG